MGTMSSIAIELEGVGRILLNRNLAVPIYQRSYAWEDEHVRDLLTDVETAMSEGAHEYFIGSIVTTKNQAARAEVADGQQRLATVTIILSAIRDFFYESGDKERANAITGELLHKKELRTLALIPKLQLNDADNEYFVNRVLLLPDDPKRASTATKPSHLRIDAAATLAREHIRRVGNSRGATERLTEIKEVRDKKISTAAQLFNRLKGILPNDPQFRASFATATVSKGYLARYYLRALEQQERGDSEPELVPNPNAEIVNLEHVLPQNASSSWSHIPPDEQVLLLKRLGNMVLMKTKINIKAGNDSFAFKKGFYSKSEFKLTNGVCAESAWNRASIEKRQSDLAGLAVKTWPLK